MKFPRIKIAWLEIIFAAFLVLALYFRFYRFDQTYEWGADNVRDFLVAKHIVVHHDFKWIAPWAFGSNNNMVNSVFYYYLLTIFYFFSFGNIFVYQLLFALFFFTVILIFSYLISKIFFKEKLYQYLSVLFFAFLPVMNIYGRGVFQPHLVLPFFIASLYYFLAAFKHRSISELSLAVFLYAIALNLHYSLLIILPWVLGMTFYLQLHFYREIKKDLNWRRIVASQLNWPSLILFLNFCFLLINQLMIKGTQTGIATLGLFFNKTFLINSKYYFFNLRDNFYVFSDGLLGANASPLPLFLFYLSILFIIFYFFLKKEKFYSASLFLAILCLPFVFLITYHNGSLPYPSYYFTPFYILLPSFLLSVVKDLNHLWKKIIMATLFFSTTALSYQQFIVTSLISNQAEISKYESVAAQISIDVGNNLSNQNDFFIFTIDDQLDWSSPKYWFYLEENLQQKLIETTSFRYNVISAQPRSRNIYLICDNPRVSWDIGKENWCLQRLRLEVRSFEQQLVYADEVSQLMIYRLTLNQAVDRYQVYSLFN